MRLTLIYTDGLNYHSFTFNTALHDFPAAAAMGPGPGLRLVRVYRYDVL